MKIKYNRTLDVATANNRKAKLWKNKRISWSKLLDEFSQTRRTAETLAEYKVMNRDRQSAIKDVGGFLGGYCAEGRRSDVTFRSLLCLDADYADTSLWSDWELLYGNAGAAYSTHKHTEEKPRLRLVIPLARNVTPEEYQAIGRKVAFNLGIEKFDDSTYQPQRIMYWPSTSQDGVFYFRYFDGPFLEPDAVLATYHDWKDISSWPTSSRASVAIKRVTDKQKDPAEKGGIVGAFCRAYSITEAIETFIPSYVPCQEQGRYTFTGGSTAAGVITYEDKYSYSHHATDPTSGQLCNAWDLVRLHRFGELDIDVDPDVKGIALPSYSAMCKFAASDSKVVAQSVSDRMAEANKDFDAPVEGDWKERLKLTEKGGIAQTIENVVTILRYDPQLSGRLALNEMQHTIVTTSALPWRKVEEESMWTDTDDASLRFYLERVYGLTGKERIFDAVNVVAQDNAFHPVRDFLDGCKWDGVERLDKLLIDYIGAEDSEYVRAVTRKTFVGAVARVYQPGVKFDYMLTIQGEQGIGKSTLLRKMGGEWFSDTFSTVQGKESFEQAIGVWIVEVGELAGLRKAEAEAVKLFISKTADRFRPAYGRRTQNFPRQCIFIATTNETHFLRDTTGNRRFWIVDTPNAAPRAILPALQQLDDKLVSLLWGEAVALYRAGEPLYLSADMEQKAMAAQSAYEEENPKTGIVEAYLDRLLPTNWENMDLFARRSWLESGEEGTVLRSTVCAMEVYAEALGGNIDRIDRYVIKEVHELMRGLKGWQFVGSNLRTFAMYGRQKFYVRRGKQ